MGGVTAAAHLTENESNGFLTSFDADALSMDNNTTDLGTIALPSTHGWPLEDLTGNVHDLMLRESMNWLPWMNDPDVKDHSPLIKNMAEGLDSQLLSQTLQLDGLFDQTFEFDQLDEVASTLFYDELVYDNSPDNSPLPTPTGDQPHHPALVDLPVPAQPYHRDEKATQVAFNDDADSTDDDSADEDDEDCSDDSEDDDGSAMTSTYMYLPKRQVEEALLDKITHHLGSDKLPGILSIVSSGDQKEDGEVEIDLSGLAREPLVRVMLYVDACLAEQQGGPKVKLAKYLVKESGKDATTTRAVLSDDDDDDDELASTAHRKRNRRTSNDTKTAGPISMAALTKKSRSRKSSLDAGNNTSAAPGPKRKRSRKKQLQDGAQSPRVARPKRRRATALHKRRMLEEMLVEPSDHDDDGGDDDDALLGGDDGLDQEVMITYGEEQMDFAVVDNQTIVHQPLPAPFADCTSMDQDTMDASSIAPQEEEDEDEEIDIM